VPEPSPDPNLPPSGAIELAPGVRVPEAMVRFAYSRSSGPGGQNVNKLSTKAELRIAIGELPISARAKERLAGLAGRRMTDAGEVLIVSETERSQSANKAECLAKLRALLIEAMHVPKVRRKTKPSRGSKERRLSEKKSRGNIKRGRSGGHDD
jgi:ribosome-associated protein